MKYQYKALFLLPVLALLLGLAAACSSDGGDDDRLRVVATTTQIGDFAANVGGDFIDLTVILQPGQDAHDFEPRPSDLRAISSADVILRNGIFLDAFVSLEEASGPIAVVSHGIEVHEDGHAHEDGDHDDHDGADHDAGDVDGDPHVWFSVPNARLMVENIRDALVQADPAHAEHYRENAAAYLARLDELDQEIRAAIQTIPAHCRKLVTDHGVLGYYAEEYGLEFLGSVIPGTASDAQASAADVAEIVRRIRDEGVPAIFAQASSSTALIEQVAQEAGVEVVGGLYGDSLGPAGSEGATYIDMMRTNTAAIAEALRHC